jgi:hypothetical protein
MRRAIFPACMLCLVLVVGLPASATSGTRLYFDSLKDLHQVGDTYSKFGITFSSNALAVTSSLKGGIGNFTGNPSGRNVMGFQSGSKVTMNVAQGFTNGISFYYSAVQQPGVVTVWSGTNGTGKVLATITLSKNNAAGCQSGSLFCVWTAVGLSFSGTAESVTFGGTAGQIGFDRVTVGSPTPSAVPESSSALLVGLGLVALSCAGRLRKISGIHS